MLKHNSKNAILYRRRYIRRLVLPGRIEEMYVVAWSTGSREKEIWRGSLKDLLVRIDDTVKFFGTWRYLI